MVSGDPPYQAQSHSSNEEQPAKTKACSHAATKSPGCFHCISCCSGGLSWPQVDSLRKMHGADKGSWGSQGHQTVAQYYEYYRNSHMTKEKSWRPSWHKNQASHLRARRNVPQLSLLVPAAATNLSDTNDAAYVGPVGLPFKTPLMQAIAAQSIVSRNNVRQHTKQSMLVQVSSS